MTFGEKLVALRNERGMSVAEIAQACNISAHSWNNYEKDMTKPRKNVIENICSIFGVTEKDLFDPEKDITKATKKKSAKAAAKPDKTKKKAETVKAKEAAPKQEAAPEFKMPEGPQVYVQSQMQDQVSMEEIIRKVLRVAPHAENIYIKPGENRAYYTGRGDTNWVWLW